MITLRRKAELFYKEYRKEKIKNDMNEINSQSSYDFDDEEFGKVNVKSSKAYSTKTKGLRWYFSLSEMEKCDIFACIGYCELHEHPKFIKFILAREGLKRFLVVTENDMEKVII